MSMDVARSNIGNNFRQSQPEQAREITPQPQVAAKAEVAPGIQHQQDEKNANALFQARYGAKQKEARPVKKTLDKDDFMRIMITEMKHQDPTKPMDADRMATQMAQITSVEQLKNVSTSLDKLADKSSASDRLAMSMMIGKTVTVDKGRFTHQKTTVSPISFDLPEPAEKVKMTILDERGEEVVVKDLDPMAAGPNSYNWDGINSSNTQSPSATYTVRIEAENKQGAKIKINPISKETVVGVTFEGGEANFLVGDTKSPQKVSLKNITRLEGDTQMRNVVQNNKTVDAQNAASDSIHARPANPNNGEFALPQNVKEKLGLNNPDGEEALKASQEQLTEAKAEGFPNGLKD